MKNLTGKKMGRSVLSTKVPIVDKKKISRPRSVSHKIYIYIYISDTAASELADCFSGAGGYECAQKVLAWTYVFPEGIDPATNMLLEECSMMYVYVLREGVCIFVTVEDYQYYWKTVKERTSSSYNRLNFGHYIAAADRESL